MADDVTEKTPAAAQPAADAEVASSLPGWLTRVQGLFPGIAWERWLRRARLALTVLTLLYAASLVTILALMHWRGEHTLLLCLFLYLPPLGWLLPLVVLTPLCYVLQRRLCNIHLACALLLIFGYMGLQWRPWPTPTGKVLRVVTHNMGQSGNTTMATFLAQEQPDIIALQESGAGNLYMRGLTNRFTAARGQFVLISRYPIVNYGYVMQPRWGASPVAAWFELNVDGRELVVYNVHMPTPRRDLNILVGGGFVPALFSPPGTVLATKREEFEGTWEARVKLAGDLAAMFQREKRPFLAVGDFNMPNHGAVYHAISATATDAFAARGRGCGYTLPGATMSPFSGFGPWLRLDYLFSSPQLTPIYCQTETGRASQHRAVAARFEWK